MPLYPLSQHQPYATAALNTVAPSGYNGLDNSLNYARSGRRRIMDRYDMSLSSRTHAKTVFRIDCRYCSAVVCLRGMKAMLLADTSVELFSTDHPPGSVQLINKDYTTPNCRCRIRDVACCVCGNEVGYHITQPCQECLKAPNNGHFWMFHTDGVAGQERLAMDLGKLVYELVSLHHAQCSVHGHASTVTDKSSTSLSFLRFLQPLKWDQLPRPELDIDLNPNSLDGEPLFADQWVKLVMGAAEATAANMCLAVDRELETDQYLEQLMRDQCLQECGLVVENVVEVSTGARELSESPTQENIEQLIDQVDEFRLPAFSYVTGDTKDEDCQGIDPYGNRRNMSSRQEDAEPSTAPIPEQENRASMLAGTAATLPALFRSGDDHSFQQGFQNDQTPKPPETWPSSAIASVMIAKMAAEAAEADAASAARDLLYGRRGRRDYNLMCR
ncbi:Protein fam72a [Mortierella sp. GBA43]|nr:Protein fam72a [Mortierella sp. GBA43]